MRSLAIAIAVTVSNLSLLTLYGCSSSSSTSSSRDALASVTRVTAERSGKAAPESATESPQATENLTWITRAEDEIAPGYSLKVKSSNDQAVNGIFQVSDTGSLRLPYDVVVQVGGLSLEAAQAKIRDAYRAYLVNPDISISVTKREYFVTVKGLVEKPGPVLVDANGSLDEIIAKAGGLAKSVQQGPSAQFAKIEQMGVSLLINLNDYYSGSAANLPKWQGGETIFLQSEGGQGVRKGSTAKFVQVIGQVKSPGEYPFTEGSDFFDYLIRAGGPVTGADLSAVQLIRTVDGKRTSFTFSASSPGSIPQIAQGDTVLILGDNPESSQNQIRLWGTVIGIFAGVAAIIAVAAGL